MELLDAFAKVLKEYRTNANISQEELAFRCELDRTYISLLERGKRNPTLNVLFNICTAIEISPSEFIKKIEDIK